MTETGHIPERGMPEHTGAPGGHFAPPPHPGVVPVPGEPGDPEEPEEDELLMPGFHGSWGDTPQALGGGYATPPAGTPVPPVAP
ncbi:hypothetical protein FNX48_024075, partial [Streptomyces sp. IF17]|nr:hypothetical protein [Streptomyces alkaliphilus]